MCWKDIFSLLAMHALSLQCGQGISTSWISSFWMLKIHLLMQARLISLLKVFFSKVSREAVLPLFNEMFAAISCVVADPDQNVKNGSELLDRWVITNFTFRIFQSVMCFHHYHHHYYPHQRHAGQAPERHRHGEQGLRCRIFCSCLKRTHVHKRQVWPLESSSLIFLNSV